jgi:flagellar biosynthesis GTPase FlhF
MKFNYSYKAFLIATLVVGNLFLWLYVVKLSKRPASNTKSYSIEYLSEDLMNVEELSKVPDDKTPVETHSVYDEYEDFIEELEAENKDLAEKTNEKLNEMEQAIMNSNNDDPSISREIIDEPEKEIIGDKEVKKETTNRNSTNSFRLKGRKALYFPNPVYTCEGFGKVVLNIEVSDLGKVLRASINKNASSTTNLCLIDSAIEYAEQTRFTTKAGLPLQEGTITYIFPGQ